MATSTKASPAKRRRKQFLVDANGRRTGVVLSVEEYEELVEAAEQLDDIRHLKKGKATGKPVPLEVVESRLRSQGKLR
ncbi:MAG: hypothetical protein JSV65_12495 [Armatimonadota bacterium]|nr:MAG: hypothetical protein JSV65_12495 [Armatimonadota bacterium]